MAMIPNKLKPSDVVKLVNSTAAFGYVLNERQLRRHRERAGFRITDDGGIDLALSDDMASRFRASNWHVQEVDGHDIDAVSEALRLAFAAAEVDRA